MPFYIESNISFQERRLRTLKHGHAFAVSIVAAKSSLGAAVPTASAIDTRYLSRLKLRLNSARCCSSARMWRKTTRY